MDTAHALRVGWLGGRWLYGQQTHGWDWQRTKGTLSGQHLALPNLESSLLKPRGPARGSGTGGQGCEQGIFWVGLPLCAALPESGLCAPSFPWRCSGAGLATGGAGIRAGEGRKAQGWVRYELLTESSHRAVSPTRGHVRPQPLTDVS